ncbi:MAG: zinc-binding alcohol dehydrogenase family protein [Candidatus Velthaea sp.]
MLAIEVTDYGDASVLHAVERPEPKPGPGEVAIRVTQTGVNFADIMARRGNYHAGGRPPFVPGLDCAGTVVAVGPGVTEIEPGRRVAAFPDGGSYADVVIARAILTYPLDDLVSDEEGAALLLLVTAYNVITLAGRLQENESILIHAAAGGVGSTAVQIARALGAGRIFATAGGADKLRVAREAGADITIDYRAEDVAARINAETNGAGVDVILDSVAGDVFANGFPVLAPFGRYVVFGQASGAPGTVKTNDLHSSNRAIAGYSSGSYRKMRPGALRPAAEASLALVARGAVKPLIGRRFALRDAAAAHELVESRKSIGKTILTPA